jgi:hypothetical protein
LLLKLIYLLEYQKIYQINLPVRAALTRLFKIKSFIKPAAFKKWCSTLYRKRWFRFDSTAQNLVKHQRTRSTTKERLNHRRLFRSTSDEPGSVPEPYQWQPMPPFTFYDVLIHAHSRICAVLQASQQSRLFIFQLHPCTCFSL